MAALVINKLRGVLQVCAVEAPGFGDRRKAILGDIAVLTGGQFISEDLGIKLENVTLEQLGRARKVKVEKESTTIINGAGKKADIRKRIEQIRAQMEQTDSEYDKEKFSERLAKLTGGVAIIRGRVEDALHATRAAVAEGIVAGGGTALLHARKALDKVQAEGDEAVINTIRKSKDGNDGFDADKGTWTDLRKAVVNSGKVTHCTLQNGASVACLLLTTEPCAAHILSRPHRFL